MFVTQLKPKEELIPRIKAPLLIVNCFGCKEVFFPVPEVFSFINSLEIKPSKIISIGYLCNDDFATKYIETYKPEFTASKSVLVFSCGVGVQTISKLLEDKQVTAGCDTIYINGFQGV